MFVILCYDVNQSRNVKVKKVVRKYLRPVQKSVCDGFISEAALKKLCERLSDIIDTNEDSVVVYKSSDYNAAEKICLGNVNLNEDFII